MAYIERIVGAVFSRDLWQTWSHDTVQRVLACNVWKLFGHIILPGNEDVARSYLQGGKTRLQMRVQKGNTTLHRPSNSTRLFFLNEVTMVGVVFFTMISAMASILLSEWIEIILQIILITLLKNYQNIQNDKEAVDYIPSLSFRDICRSCSGSICAE